MLKTENQYGIIPGSIPEGTTKEGSRKGLKRERKHIKSGVEEKLKESQKMLQRLASHLDEIMEHERSEIALNLHDDPGQKLTAISMNIAWVKCREEFQIDKRISLTLYRILQESLTNITRHSEASAAEVKLRLIRNKIELQIKDNGIGINENDLNPLTSMGIAGLKERVNSVYGRLLIRGEKGSETSIKVSIPLKSGNKDD